MLTMFDSLKAISRRVVGVFLTVVGAVFGQWHPPLWLLWLLMMVSHFSPAPAAPG